jgi:hypothetical protein
LRDDATEGIVYDAIADARCAGALLKVAVASRHLKGIRGTSRGFVRPTHAAQALAGGSLIESRERFRSQVWVAAGDFIGPPVQDACMGASRQLT